ncbi:site-specific DNA-methyltransferase [Ruminococcus albus]|uniref:Site-specific DNA-methyltransferase (Adenine-specific) n=1 Tax=Ruminococcus albus (strain ATCC 27210 / DSM 20455 / JCM 14654 / NCDO 2250 / 7) TaxID=697329 RepID=E6UCL1_RUMA7|nr:site-specific DNA-methyltransferase [Ruminococcus albus]ADU21616.1 Site-specific DNA-methyltransferase (adenine-specific) [Ruminococcus albus 7 = DSM 20455]
MDKLKMHTPDLADENFKKLASLFPNAVTETITGYDADGNAIVERAIDADVLRQEISATVVEGAQERYQFTWPDKKKSIVLANQPIAKTLRLDRKKSVGRDGTPGSIDTENIYIEGDNLDALKLLQETYLGKVKMIYIDPPYNTGNDFIYEDDFSLDTGEYLGNSGQFDEEGNRLVQNTESNGRFHTDWLNMMYPRLRIAKDLLSEDGAIFISIDEHEVGNLRKMCDEVFGGACFVSDVAWQRTYSMRNDVKGIAAEIEHVLVYGKQPAWQPKKLARTEKMDSKYKNPDNDPRGAWRNIVASAPNAATHQGMVYAIQNPITGEYAYPPQGRCWSLGQDFMLNAMNQWCDYELKNIHDDERRAEVCGVSTAEVRKDVLAIVLKGALAEAKQKALAKYQGVLPEFFFSKKGEGTLSRKAYINEVAGRPVTNFWSFEETGHTDEASRLLKELFDGTTVFDTPKPVRLLDRIITIATNTEDVVLDFFSGSGTTAESLLKMNMSDSGNRKYILVQINEETRLPSYANLCEIGEERIRRAGKKIKEENPLTTADLDIGFRVFKVDSSNMEDVYYRPADLKQDQIMMNIDNVKADRTPEDLLFQSMLDLGILLSSEIEETEFAGKKVFSVAGGYLIACFDFEITEETVTEIAKKKPFYAVFRDAGYANDSVATNFEQIFETYSPKTKRKVL